MDYVERIQAAIDFIEERLWQDVNSSDVCCAIGFSEYHFHRVFQGMLGESVAAYMRKRRLSEAAKQLRSSSTAILDIALASQFDSQESFTRAFKKMFGVSPNQFRKNGDTASSYLKKRTNIDMIEHLQTGIHLEPVYKEFDGALVVGMASGFAEGEHKEIGQLWDRFNVRQGEIKNVKPGCAFGICMASHPSVEKKERQTFVYMSGLPVSKVESMPDGMISCEIPARKYAVFTHKGSLDTLPHTVNYIWGTWVPKNIEAYQHKDAIDFELYDDRFDPKTLSGEFDIYIPV